METHIAQSQPVQFAASDGYVLRGRCWRHGDGMRPVVIVNPATSVQARYYARFAAFLHGEGFDVLTYDYRGIGESRPPSLRGFDAGWIDWGQLDFEAALQFVEWAFPGQPVQVVAHSVGGFLVGLAPSSHRVSRVFSMGAQFAYWKDYARDRRTGLFLKWHVVMPALTALYGYFPGGRLGWLEDTPRGVVRDWTARHPRFEDAWGRGETDRHALVERFAGLRGETLALSLSDDEFGTPAAIRRLLAYYRHSPRTHLHLRPESIGERQVGHFAFFHSRYRENLWQIPLQWLRHGQVGDWPDSEILRM